MIRSMLSGLESSVTSSNSQQKGGKQEGVAICKQMAPIMQSDHKLGLKNYKPLLERPTSSE